MMCMTLHKFPGLDLYHTDPVHRIITTGTEMICMICMIYAV